MKRVKRAVERWTGVLFGSFRQRHWFDTHGPRPRPPLAVRPSGTSWVAFEFGMLGRGFYATWGSHELTPGERVENALSGVDMLERFRPLSPVVDVLVVGTYDQMRMIGLGRRRDFDAIGRRIIVVSDGHRAIHGMRIGEVEWTELAWRAPGARELDLEIRRAQAKAGRR